MAAVEWLKAHWLYVAGGVIALYVVYEILSASSSSSASSGDTSGGDSQVAALQAASDLQSAQVNGQVEIASYQANTVNNQTVAALQLGEVQTAAELAASQSQTNGAVTENQANDTALEQVEKTVTAGQVQQTQIEGNTYEALATTAASVPLAQINAVATQVNNIQTYSPNANEAIKAFEPALALELGQPTAGLTNSNKGSTTAQNISAVGGAASSILSGLFGLAAV